MLDYTKPHVEKFHYIGAELAEHVHKLDVKLQSLCGSGFSLFGVSIPPTLYHFGVNWPTTLCQNKDWVHFFTLTLECHNSNNKLFLCDSANGDIAQCSKNYSEWGLCVFFKKRTNTCFCFFKKKQQKADLKNRMVGFFLKAHFFSTVTTFQFFFVIFPWSHDLEQVTSLSVWLGVRRTPKVKDPGNEEAENYCHLNAWKLVLTTKQVSKN